MMYPNEQPQQVVHGQMPPPQQPQQPQQPQSFTQPQQQQQQQTPPSNMATFVADDKVLELIKIVYPQLASAMINIAVKKFAEDPDFLRYFVKDEYKESFEKYLNKEKEIQESARIKSEPLAQKETSTSTTSTPAPEMDFTSW